MKIDSNILELKFKGDDIEPSKVSITELISILSAYNGAIRSLVEITDPLIDIDDDFISLIEIGNNSFGLKTIVKKYKDLARNAFYSLAIAASTGDISDLPGKASAAIRIFGKFNEKWNCYTHFGYIDKNQSFKEISFFKRVAISKVKHFKDSKTFYGELVKIGGEVPKAHILSINGSYINADLTKEEVLLYNSLLYKEVKVKGQARYSGETLKLSSFKVESIEEYKTLSASESVRAIKNSLKSL